MDQFETPTASVTRFGLNVALATFIFALPAAVVFFDHKPGQEQVATSKGNASPDRLQEVAQHSPPLPALEAKVFLRRVEHRLPRYRPLFKQAANRYGIPWTLLAAQGYQESRWNPKAVSPTGVRGLMQLTRVTSSMHGIENRLDPLQSIRGGARHLARLLKYLPKEIQEPDRIWIALAAYNVGMGHVKDARILAQRLGKNPNRWDDLKTVLPLLAQKKYYRTLPHRYARGWEPVQYVRRIQGFYALMKDYHQTPPQTKTPLL